MKKDDNSLYKKPLANKNLERAKSYTKKIMQNLKNNIYIYIWIKSV